MNLDDILLHVYLKNSIHLNTDNICEKDIENFIEFIKGETDSKIQNKVYVHKLFCVKKNNKDQFECENASLVDKFKVIMYDDNAIKIAEIDKEHKGRISMLSYNDILRIELKEVEDPNNYYYDAYELDIFMNDESKLILNTSLTVSQIRKDMNNFLIGLKKTFDKYKENKYLYSKS